MYLVERLSAMRIADAYGLKYKNPKVAESTVLYHLRRNGIRRRDAADHVRKVTEGMVDGWVERYDRGESLKDIAGQLVSPVTVWNHLKARRVVLRDKVLAQIKKVSKYERSAFHGDSVERAYLMGLRYGDLHVLRHGRAVRVRVTTTHPAMADLFEKVFSPFTHVARYPRAAGLVGFEWTLECDLDKSFAFLLAKPTIFELRLLSEKEKLAFLAGLFDAEGSIFLHQKMGRYNPEISFSNTDVALLEFVHATMESIGFKTKLVWREQAFDRRGISGPSTQGRVILWRFESVQRLLSLLPLRHGEKVAKRALVMRMEYRGSSATNLSISQEWDSLIRSIREARDHFVKSARRSITHSMRQGISVR